MDPIQGHLAFNNVAVLTVEELWSMADDALLKIAEEDRRIERKPVGIHAWELAEYFSMWANTAAEGGLIAVGISNKGAFDGCLSMEIQHINRLERDAQDYCGEAHVEVRRIRGSRHKDGEPDFVLSFS